MNVQDFFTKVTYPFWIGYARLAGKLPGEIITIVVGPYKVFGAHSNIQGMLTVVQPAVPADYDRIFAYAVTPTPLSTPATDAELDIIMTAIDKELASSMILPYKNFGKGVKIDG